MTITTAACVSRREIRGVKTVSTFVLVDGAFLDGSAWTQVINRLQQHRHVAPFELWRERFINDGDLE
ncbi:hypothetical protein [Mycobacterium sp. AZCC_0083]|uniref:hypothetical protein n=1 Tax=Mycobacterium sp. AZCC_0083 TaxID=2735882 RepID=UPI00185C431B|nr:hypothetical protein [Mycobacterium sp. AZCC_0083]MBB5167624.1 hypothetical protein [Mycobacterium sp. AZCC_0083]